jgi:hypothetical protein
MLLVSANIPDIPVALDTSLVFIDAITGPSTATAGEIIPVLGSATILSGPFNPADFDYYELSYRESGESLWIPFDSTHHSPVYNGTLGFWNTDGFIPGYYELRCLLVDTNGNPIEALKQVNLIQGGIEEKDISETRQTIPFSLIVRRKEITIENHSEAGVVSLYDLSGRCVKKITVKEDQTIVWLLKRSGIYFVRLDTGNESFVKKAVIF